MRENLLRSILSLIYENAVAGIEPLSAARDTMATMDVLSQSERQYLMLACHDLRELSHCVRRRNLGLASPKLKMGAFQTR